MSTGGVDGANSRGLTSASSLPKVNQISTTGMCAYAKFGDGS